MTNTDSNVLTL